VNRATYAVTRMCRLLGVSTSGFYGWLKRTPSIRSITDASLTKVISEIHAWSRGTYGVPRMLKELRARGIDVGKRRIERLMRQAKIQGVSRRKKVFTTKRDSNARPAPDLVQREFTASGPNQVWVADITHIPTGTTPLYLAVVLDVWSRRIVGWAMESHMRKELVLSALNMAIEQRKPEQVIHHSDQGSQYTSIAFGKRCIQAGVKPSMGSAGDCYDNAMCESFFASLECELIDRSWFPNHRVTRLKIFDYIEGWYNPHRRHSGIDYLSPINFERSHQQHRSTGTATLST